MIFHQHTLSVLFHSRSFVLLINAAVFTDSGTTRSTGSCSTPKQNTHLPERNLQFEPAATDRCCSSSSIFLYMDIHTSFIFLRQLAHCWPALSTQTHDTPPIAVINDVSVYTGSLASSVSDKCAAGGSSWTNTTHQQTLELHRTAWQTLGSWTHEALVVGDEINKTWTEVSLPRWKTRSGDFSSLPWLL